MISPDRLPTVHVVGNGLLYAAIVVVWAVVLVPMWLRRHDEGVETRSVDRFSAAMRVLSRRTGRPAREQRYVVVPPRQPAEPAERAPERTLRRPRDESRARLMARRRRVVLGLLLVTALTLVLGAVGLIGWVPFPVLSTIALLGYLAHLRVQARRLREQEWRRRAADGRLRAQARREDTARPAYARPDRRSDRQPVTTAPTAVPTPLPVDLADEHTVRLVASAEEWSPTPVPLPTYVTKPKAPGSAVRSIDLSPGLWAGPAATAPAAADLPEQAVQEAAGEAAATGAGSEAQDRPEPAEVDHYRAVND